LVVLGAFVAPLLQTVSLANLRKGRMDEEDGVESVRIRLADLSAELSDSFDGLHGRLRDLQTIPWERDPSQLNYFDDDEEEEDDLRFVSKRRATKTRPQNAANRKFSTKKVAQKEQKPSRFVYSREKRDGKVFDRLFSLAKRSSQVETIKMPGKNQVSKIHPNSRLTRPTEATISRDTFPADEVLEKEAKHRRMTRLPSFEEEMRCHKLMRNQTESLKNRNKILRDFRNHHDDGFEESESTGRKSMTPDSVSRKRTAVLVSTFSEGAKTWSGEWGTRDLREAVWIGPKDGGESSDEIDPEDFSCDISNSESRRKVVERKSIDPNRKSILERAEEWASKRFELQQEESTSNGFQSTPVRFDFDFGSDSGSKYSKKYLELQKRLTNERKFDSEEAESLLTILSSLPDGYRQSVEQMISERPIEAATSFKKKVVIQEKKDIDAESNVSAGKKQQTSVKPSEKAIFHKEAVDAHVERMKRVRSQKEDEERRLKSKLHASKWTPNKTIPKPFRLSTGTQRPRTSNDKSFPENAEKKEFCVQTEDFVISKDLAQSHYQYPLSFHHVHHVHCSHQGHVNLTKHRNKGFIQDEEEKEEQENHERFQTREVKLFQSKDDLDIFLLRSRKKP